jgi:transposase
MEFSVRSTDKRTLKRWLRSTTLPQGQITRAKIILALDQGWTPTAVAEAQQVSAKSVHKWRNRYLEAGIDGLYDQPRSGRPTKITEKTVKRVLELTTQYVPEEATQWSVQLMAKYAQITTWQVRQIWNAADLKPHRLKTFKISNDPDFAEKVIDIVGLYH